MSFFCFFLFSILRHQTNSVFYSAHALSAQSCSREDNRSLEKCQISTLHSLEVVSGIRKTVTGCWGIPKRGRHRTQIVKIFMGSKSRHSWYLVGDRQLRNQRDEETGHIEIVAGSSRPGMSHIGTWRHIRLKASRDWGWDAAGRVCLTSS